MPVVGLLLPVVLLHAVSAIGAVLARLAPRVLGPTPIERMAAELAAAHAAERDLAALPYGLIRMTWLTPWPVGIAAADLAANPATRLHGVLLGLASLAGAVLTTGLISRWGEIWPRWMPVVRGRPVPVAAAVVPGTLVAALFTVAAAPMTAMWISAGEPWAILVFPFPIWGPALGVAVLGYALRRRQATSAGHSPR